MPVYITKENVYQDVVFIRFTHERSEPPCSFGSFMNVVNLDPAKLRASLSADPANPWSQVRS